MIIKLSLIAGVIEERHRELVENRLYRLEKTIRCVVTRVLRYTALELANLITSCYFKYYLL